MDPRRMRMTSDHSAISRRHRPASRDGGFLNRYGGAAIVGAIATPNRAWRAREPLTGGFDGGSHALSSSGGACGRMMGVSARRLPGENRGT